MHNTFQDKVVLINGGASGMGREVVRQLAGFGAVIIVTDRNAETGTKLAHEQTKRGRRVEFRQVEMTDTAAVERLFADVYEDYDRIDYVYNIAGSFMAGEMRDTPIENWHYIMDEDIHAVFNGAHFAYQTLLKQGHGHILNMGSSAGLFPVPSMGIYGASKYAIVGLSHAMRIEAKDLGIKVSVMCPIIVNTPLYDAAVYNNLDKKKFLKTRHYVQKPKSAARKIIRGTARNKATIHTSILGKIGWWSVRFMPGAYDFFALRTIRAYRKHLRVTQD